MTPHGPRRRWIAEHARRGGGDDVVVDPVAHVGDLGRRQRRPPTITPREERRVGLGDAPGRGGGDEVAGRDQRGHRRGSAPAGWLPATPTRTPPARSRASAAAASG